MLPLPLTDAYLQFLASSWVHTRRPGPCPPRAPHVHGRNLRPQVRHHQHGRGRPVHAKRSPVHALFSGHKNIVRFIDAEFVTHQGQHTFILMEYCQGGHVVDLMNSRLHDRLKEREILKIFGDACEGVASMHYAKPPVIHRDIKVENLLVSNSDDYKLCDFGSATTQILPPRSPNFSVSKTQLDLIHEDVQKHTTLQYRAPELCDVYSGRGINEKVDIWALGVMLFKLCYYTTPFEKEGASTVTAIMSGRYNIPADPPFSKDLIALIQWCLLDHPSHRPTIYQLVHEICRLRGIKCPIDNIY
ncbi:kinase-like domain-containing protein, partial [Catenaria anguillulae PL171]